MRNILAISRKSKGFNQIQLSEIVGVTQQTLSSWERGRTLPKPYQMQKLEDVLEISKEKIFFDAFDYSIEH